MASSFVKVDIQRLSSRHFQATSVSARPTGARTTAGSRPCLNAHGILLSWLRWKGSQWQYACRLSCTLAQVACVLHSAPRQPRSRKPDSCKEVLIVKRATDRLTGRLLLTGVNGPNETGLVLHTHMVAAALHLALGDVA